MFRRRKLSKIRLYSRAQGTRDSATTPLDARPQHVIVHAGTTESAAKQPRYYAESHTSRKQTTKSESCTTSHSNTSLELEKTDAGSNTAALCTYLTAVWHVFPLDHNSSSLNVLQVPRMTTVSLYHSKNGTTGTGVRTHGKLNIYGRRSANNRKGRRERAPRRPGDGQHALSRSAHSY